MADERVRMNLKDHVPFVGGLDSMFMTSMEAANMINDVFKSVFHDYVGCNVRINDGRNPVVANKVPIGTMYVDMYFKNILGRKNNDGEEEYNGLKSVVPFGTSAKKAINGGKKSDKELSDEEKKANESSIEMCRRLQKITGAASTMGRAYELNTETHDILSKFMPDGDRTIWSNHEHEVSVNMNAYGKTEILIEVTGLLLINLLYEIFGTENGQYEYSAVASTIIPSRAEEFVMQISRLKRSTVQELQAKLGVNTVLNPEFHSCR